MSPKSKDQFKAPSHIAEAGATPAAAVSAGPLAGTWTNTTSNNLVKVVIAASGSGISVDAFGACTPTPCNWGSVAGTAYAANVSSSAAVGFTAEYKFSFANVTMAGHLQGSELVVETYTVFTDGSGRSNFYASETMKK